MEKGTRMCMYVCRATRRQRDRKHDNGEGGNARPVSTRPSKGSDCGASRNHARVHWHTPAKTQRTRTQNGPYIISVFRGAHICMWSQQEDRSRGVVTVAAATSSRTRSERTGRHGRTITQACYFGRGQVAVAGTARRARASLCLRIQLQPTRTPVLRTHIRRIESKETSPG